MYAASSSPRSAMIRLRIASSSSPNVSSCSSVRVVVFMVSSSEVDDAVADRGVDTDLDVLVRERGLDTGQHVADGALGLAGRAREADPHPAAELRLQPQRLGLLQQGGAGVLAAHAG